MPEREAAFAEQAFSVGSGDARAELGFSGHLVEGVQLVEPAQIERYHRLELTAQRIDTEIARILDEAHGTARRILEEHRGKLETVTRRLLEVEVMEGDELRRLLGAEAAPPASSGAVS